MTAINSGDFNNIARAISVYADGARADEALILSSGVTASDARITDAGENFTGVLRWLTYSDGGQASKPSASDDLNTPNAITAFMAMGNLSETYIKNVDVVAARENSIQSLISRVDGLSYLGRQFGSVRARREDANFRAVIQGVGDAIYGSTADLAADTAATLIDGSAAGRDAASGQDPANPYAFGYRTAYTHSSTSFTPLFVNENTDNNRSAFFDVLLDAMTAVSGEFEEAFYYLVVSPSTFNILRKQNVLDVNPVQDGNLNINTLLGGKIRLIVTGNTLGAGTIQSGLNVSYLLKAGAVHYSNVAVNNPVAMDNNPLYNQGFGDVSIVSRWGNIIHPRGYSYAGSANAFPANSTLNVAASWTRAAQNVNQTGIFPIFHG